MNQKSKPSAAKQAMTVVDDDQEIGGGSPIKSDYMPFIWQRLDAFDKRIGDMQESYGRLDAKVDSNGAKLDGLKTDLKKIDALVTWTRATVVVFAALIGVLFAVYKLLEPYISITVHAAK